MMVRRKNCKECGADRDRRREDAYFDCRRRIFGDSVYRNNIRRAAAMLLALGLCAVGVCAAAEDTAGSGLQTEIMAQTTVVSEEVDGMPVIFADEAEPGGVDAEIVPETEGWENADAEEAAVPEISVEMIQVGDGEDSAGADLPVGEAEASENELTENGLTDTESSETGDGTADGEASGECGAQPGTVYWSLDAEGVLTITGNGPMADWESVEQTPWFSRLADLRGIVIAEGVVSVGAHAFSGAQTVGAVELADSIERVGAFAFFRCGGFGSVSIG